MLESQAQRSHRTLDQVFPLRPSLYTKTKTLLRIFLAAFLTFRCKKLDVYLTFVDLAL